MKTRSALKLASVLAGVGLMGLTASAQVAAPSTYRHITIDGSFTDWAGIPIAYTAPLGSSNAIQYQNVYVANDQSNLYVRFTLYTPRANAFSNPYDNFFVDNDNNPATGFQVGGIGSGMLIQWGGGYQEVAGNFNAGAINNLGSNLAGSADSTSFEFSVSLGATYAADNSLVFSNSTFAILLEGDDSSYINTAFAPTNGGLVYTLATQIAPPTTNLALVTLTNSLWKANASGTDLGSNWLSSSYDDTVSGWVSGNGLLGYTPSSGSYPHISTALSSGPNTYYFRTHFTWTNDSQNVAFVVTNYLSDGAVYYLNGAEVRRVRMPSGTITYATAASATNSPLGHADVFGIDGAGLINGDNILEVETHQAPASASDMVFGLSLTAAVQYPVTVVNASLPANQGIFAGQPVTFTSDVIGSGPLSYQWYFNGTNVITNANSASYTIASVLTNNAGTYSLLVSNSFSSATTRAALLTVSNSPISITNQPANQLVVEGKPVTFSVAVSGTPVINYQWYFGSNPIAGATNATYTIASALPVNAGSYKVLVSNPANSVFSTKVNLTVLLDTIPPAITNIFATSTQIVVSFSEPVDPTTAATAAKYVVSGGNTVISAQVTNSSQVILTMSSALSFGSVYTLTTTGIKDLFGNSTKIVAQFARDIKIDGSIDDWTGLTPVYSSSAPSGNTDAADFKDIYAYNDSSNYYFRVTLWTDIDPSYGQFPFYVNMFFNTDGDPNTGYSAIGSEVLIQSGYSYQEKNGGFNDGFSINGLNWLSLPAAPSTNFEFQLSRSATFQDGTPLFSTNYIEFLFQGMTPGFVIENTAPSDGVMDYTNVPSVTVAPLPLGGLSIATLSGGQAAVTWDASATLQQAPSLSGATWTNLPSATSPYLIPASTGKQFFRLKK